MPHSTETAAKPAWEVFLEKEIIDEDLTDSYYITENTLYDVIRRMLHAPSNDNDAAATAVEEFRAFYVSYSPDNEERYGFNHESDSAARGLTGLIYEVTWKLAGVIWFRDFKHKRLSDFAVVFKVAAPAVVDIENPQMPSDTITAARIARDFWHQYSVGISTKSRPNPKGLCETWINVSVFLARLFEAGVILVEELYRAIRDITEGLETPKDDQCVCELKIWSSSLKKIAETPPDVDEWRLEKDAAEAYTKTTELISEREESHKEVPVSEMPSNPLHNEVPHTLKRSEEEQTSMAVDKQSDNSTYEISDVARGNSACSTVDTPNEGSNTRSAMLQQSPRSYKRQNPGQNPQSLMI
ncbi:hypothetical protein S7711_10418 [Stachybotrys chartarum IBT 7711]|uniref:Uncharacterized protein n=1 Tax=Stachybotrys chartarum (strain CBS 109288 / IBT 7711) TaxID=1280523 RepID=A0A084B4E2_STACB|nr:hypothetical protein S7711_10418 [Stachybotrys chartarum IBT 7711]